MNYVDQISYQQSSKYIENLSNEYKGNLFEYLVGEELARILHLEANFYTNIPANYRQVLQNYTQNLKNINRSALTSLPKLAKNVANAIATFCLSEGANQFKNIFLIGKIENESIHAEFKEADLLLIQADGSNLPISLKLCKDNSYINTKSGGIKSFFAKYFIQFPHAELIQQLLNSKINFEFQKMLESLCEELAIPKNEDPLKIRQAILNRGLSLLPGELPLSLQNRVLNYYYVIANFIYEKMYELYCSDRATFIKALQPICGMGNPSLLQVFVLHNGYQLQTIKLQNLKKLEANLTEIEFIKSEQLSKSFFELTMPDYILQIRVKPMNEYLVPSLKINCSLKVRCDK